MEAGAYWLDLSWLARLEKGCESALDRLSQLPYPPPELIHDLQLLRHRVARQREVLETRLHSPGEVAEADQQEG